MKEKTKINFSFNSAYTISVDSETSAVWGAHTYNSKPWRNAGGCARLLQIQGRFAN